MDIGSWLALLAGGCGAAVAVYGAVILSTGRATRGDQRAFRRLKDAGMYYLCYGLAMTLLMSGVVLNEHQQSLMAIVALVGALTLASVAVVRYRPAKGMQR